MAAYDDAPLKCILSVSVISPLSCAKPYIALILREYEYDIEIIHALTCVICPSKHRIEKVLFVGNLSKINLRLIGGTDSLFFIEDHGSNAKFS